MSFVLPSEVETQTDAILETLSRKSFIFQEQGVKVFFKNFFPYSMSPPAPQQ